MGRRFKWYDSVLLVLKDLECVSKVLRWVPWYEVILGRSSDWERLLLAIDPRGLADAEEVARQLEGRECVEELYLCVNGYAMFSERLLWTPYYCDEYRSAEVDKP